MTLDGLLTLLALLVAAWGIISRSQRLDIKLRASRVTYAVCITSLICVLSLHYSQYLERLGIPLATWLRQGGIAPADGSFAIIVFAALFVGVRLTRFRLTPRRIHSLLELAEELAAANEHRHLLRLVDRYIDDVCRISRGDYLRVKLRLSLSEQSRFFSSASWPETLVAEGYSTVLVKRLSGWMQWMNKRFPRPSHALRSTLVRVLPSYEEESRAASQFLQAVLTRRSFVRFLSANRPYLGASIIRREFFSRPEFLKLFLNEQLRDHSSTLYFEIRNNQQLEGHQYAIPPDNKLLHTLLANANFASAIAVYQPIGNFMVAHLDRLHLTPSVDPYNAPMLDFHDEGCFESELWVGITFFDIMVLRALHQGVEWHMWLYYFPPIVEGICANVTVDERTCDPRSEWPNRYCYLLYTMFSAMTKWVEVIRELPIDQPNIRLCSVDATHENENIPKSSILAIGSSLKSVLVEDKLPEQFRFYLLDMVLRLYFHLQQLPKLRRFAETLLNTIGRCTTYETQNRFLYFDMLIRGLDDIDLVKYDQDAIKEVRQFLEASAK